MQRYAAENLFGEGECFAALVNSAQVGSPQIQMFDNFEVRYIGAAGAPPRFFGAGQVHLLGWRKTKRNSKVIAYSIQTADGGAFVDVDAANMIHIADFKRPNQVRAISPFHAGANSALDALDIKGLEVASIKLHSLLGVVFKKNTGRGVGEGGLSGSLTELFNTVTNPDGSQTKQNSSVVGENFFAGGATAHVGADEDIKLLTSERPTINLINYLEWLYRTWPFRPGFLSRWFGISPCSAALIRGSSWLTLNSFSTISSARLPLTSAAESIRGGPPSASKMKLSVHVWTHVGGIAGGKARPSSPLTGTRSPRISPPSTRA